MIWLDWLATKRFLKTKSVTDRIYQSRGFRASFVFLVCVSVLFCFCFFQFRKAVMQYSHFILEMATTPTN